jgi:hypothetical protein
LSDHGNYQLRDAARNKVVAGEQYDLDIDAVEAELRRREAALVAGRARGAPR